MLIYDSWLGARAGREGIGLWEAGRRPPLKPFLHTEVLSRPTFVSFFLMIVKGGQMSQTKMAPAPLQGLPSRI